MIRATMIKLLLRFRGKDEPSDAKKRIGSWILRNVPGMLTCAEVERFVFAYAEGALSKKQRDQFDLHRAIVVRAAHGIAARHHRIGPGAQGNAVRRRQRLL